jgi:hypothetical protein
MHCARGEEEYEEDLHVQRYVLYPPASPPPHACRVSIVPGIAFTSGDISWAANVLTCNVLDLGEPPRQLLSMPGTILTRHA